MLALDDTLFGPACSRCLGPYLGRRRIGRSYRGSLAPLCRNFPPVDGNIVLVLSQCLGKDMAAVIVADEVEFIAIGGMERGAKRDLAGVGNGARWQTASMLLPSGSRTNAP